MKLTPEQVKHIAHLARLQLTEKEIEKYSGQMSDILDWVEMLKQVDTKNVEPLSQVTGIENSYRSDIVEECDEQTRERLLDSAPEVEDDLIKTKSVF